MVVSYDPLLSLCIRVLLFFAFIIIYFKGAL